MTRRTPSPHKPFQSPCAGNMFGKVWACKPVALPECVMTFQSPCAGNMFGKSIRRIRFIGAVPVVFQSPCAGNMFGKTYSGYAQWRKDFIKQFQSPCAGNMFGKKAIERHTLREIK